MLAPIELAFRALLGHELGRVDPCAHLDPTLLGPTARNRAGGESEQYRQWRDGYEHELRQSREDFVEHHHNKYGGKLPVWAAVELLDWGGLSYLYGFAPRDVQDAVADACGLRAPQLASWLTALNLVRDTCAHHGRLFNRVHTITPKLPRVGVHPDLDAAVTQWSRTFGQLTLIQFLLDRPRARPHEDAPGGREELTPGGPDPALPLRCREKLADRQPTLDSVAVAVRHVIARVEGSRCESAADARRVVVRVSSIETPAPHRGGRLAEQRDGRSARRTTARR